MDSCFVCELLYPRERVEDCPRCGRRMRYQPAVMMSHEELREALGERMASYARAAEPDARARELIELLEMLHRFAPVSLELMSELGGPDMDALRRDYEAVAARGW